MTGIRKNIWKHLADRIFRREYVAEHAKSGVAYQIKAMRESRGWSQADLAKKSGKSQSNIARLEDPDYGKFSVQTLLEMADAFDVWLSVEFVSFRTGLARTFNRSPHALNAVSFDQEAKDAALTMQLSSNTLFASPPDHIIGGILVAKSNTPFNTPNQGLNFLRSADLHKAKQSHSGPYPLYDDIAFEGNMIELGTHHG